MPTRMRTARMLSAHDRYMNLNIRIRAQLLLQNQGFLKGIDKLISIKTQTNIDIFRRRNIQLTYQQVD